MNTGLQIHELNPTDWHFGGFTPLENNIWQIDGDWERYLPVVEYQNNHAYDRMACVSYSLLTCLEIQQLRQTGREVNYSDRALAKMSGTTETGNRLDTVFDTAREKGLLPESEWPDTPGGWDEYYKDIPDEIERKAGSVLETWSLYREWVAPYDLTAIREALKEAPLQVTARYASGSGLLKPAGTPNHAICLYGIDEGYKVYDHYTQTRKRYSLDYEFGVILKPYLIKKNNNTMIYKQNQLIAKSQGGGYNFGIHIDGKLLIGETDDVLATWTLRNKDYNNKVTVTLEEWNKLAHYDLKGNKI
jgi:hypothetical protein